MLADGGIPASTVIKQMLPAQPSPVTVHHKDMGNEWYHTEPSLPSLTEVRVLSTLLVEYFSNKAGDSLESWLDTVEVSQRTEMNKLGAYWHPPKEGVWHHTSVRSFFFCPSVPATARLRPRQRADRDIGAW